MLKVGSLFAGIGGFDLGLEATGGFQTAWFVESDPFCQAVLREHWPTVPIFTDVRDVCADCLPPVDVLAGGFPCQDISVAGRGEGIDGARSGLWAEFARLIGELRPDYVLVENVSALLTRGLGRVIGHLSTLGYDAEWDCLPASAFSAPHQRDRLWLVAYPDCNGVRVKSERDQREGRRVRTSQCGHPVAAHHGTQELVADTARAEGGPLTGSNPDREGRELEPELDCQSVKAEPGARRVNVDGFRDVMADPDRAGFGERRGTVAVRPEQSSVERGGEVVADPDELGRSGRSGNERQGWRGEPQNSGLEVPNPEREGSQGQSGPGVVGCRREAVVTSGEDEGGGGARFSERDLGGVVDALSPWMDSRAMEGWWETEPPVSRVIRRQPNRVSRLRALGNALVPVIPHWIGSRILEFERSDG